MTFKENHLAHTEFAKIDKQFIPGWGCAVYIWGYMLHIEVLYGSYLGIHSSYLVKYRFIFVD